MVRRGAPLAPRATGAFAALAGAGLSSVAACLSRPAPHPTTITVVVWHFGTPLMLVSIGGVGWWTVLQLARQPVDVEDSVKRTVACIATAVMMAIALVAIGRAQDVRKVDVSKLGPQVGATVPDFTLRDQRGKSWTLQSVMGPKGAMLVFYRSADWCPYCKTQLLELQSQYEQLRKDGLGLVAISYDPQDILAAFSDQHGIMFPLLSDPGSATIKRYGILNTVAQEALGPNKNDPAVIAQAKLYVSANGTTERMLGIPFPGTFIVDRAGRVKARFFEGSYTVRNTVSNIRVKLNDAGASVAATKVQAQQLDVTTYASDSALAPGNRFSVIARIAPHAGVHVYAPGAANYRIIDLKIVPNQYIRPLGLSYPPSEIYTFKPLNESVATYQKPFTLVQEMVLDGQASTRTALRDQTSLTIGGALMYQACDDRLCYDPVSLPLSWTVGLKPIVTQPTARPATK